MDSTILIDVLTARRGPYDEPSPIEIGIGGERVKVQLTNIPRDMTGDVTRLQQNYRDLSRCHDEEVAGYQKQVSDLKQQVGAFNDSPRPPLVDDTLRQLLTYLKNNPLPIESAIATNLIVVTRMLTGWGAVQAKTFVESIA